MRNLFALTWQNAIKPAALGVHRRLLPPDCEREWIPYLWLVWTVFYFLAMLPPAGPASVAATVPIMAAFYVLYFRHYWARGVERHCITLLIVALGIALAPFNYTGGGLLIYAASHAGNDCKPRNAILAIAALAAICVIEYLLLGLPVVVWIWAPTVIVVVGLACLWGAERERQNHVLRLSQQEVRRLAATAERERIARDLHDLLGHTLTLITVKADLAGTLAERDLPGAAREIRDLEQVARDALAQVRRAVGGYRGDLGAEIANAGVALHAAGIAFASDTSVGRAGDADGVLAMVVREAVTNIVRHSGANTCRLSLRREDDQRIILDISDDGTAGRCEEGNGIRGMRERLEAMGGQLSIDFRPDETRLRVTIPVDCDSLTPHLSRRERGQESGESDAFSRSDREQAVQPGRPGMPA
jgi:two-component system sensor histidine kinase DesK